MKLGARKYYNTSFKSSRQIDSKWQVSRSSVAVRIIVRRRHLIPHLIWRVWGILVVVSGWNSRARCVAVTRRRLAAVVGRRFVAVTRRWFAAVIGRRLVTVARRCWGSVVTGGIVVNRLPRCIIAGSSSRLLVVWLFIVSWSCFGDVVASRLCGVVWRCWGGVVRRMFFVIASCGVVGRSCGGVMLLIIGSLGGVVNGLLLVVRRNCCGVVLLLVCWRWCVRLSLFVIGGRFLAVITGRRLQVVGAWRVSAGDVVTCRSLVSSLRGVCNRLVSVASSGIRWSGIVTRFFVLVPNSGISWRSIINSFCGVLLVVGLGGIRRSIIVSSSSCVVGGIIVVIASCGIIASSGVSCWSIIRSRCCVIGWGFSLVASSGVRRSRVVSSRRRVVGWSLSLCIRRRRIRCSRCLVVRRSSRGVVRSRFVSSRLVFLQISHIN